MEEVMFHEISERLVAWAAAVAGEPIATLGPPSAETSGRRISLSLVDVIPQATSDASKARLEVSLRYLATVSAGTPVEAHRLLGLLTFAAMSRADLAVDGERPTMQFWLALGATPQPCLSFQVTASQPHTVHRPPRGDPGTIDRRRSPAGSHPKNGCAFQRRATDWRPAALSSKQDIRTQMSAWRDRC
jgi:hypothetical protein